MFVCNPKQPLVIATDWRLSSDRDLDLSDHVKPHVLHCWRLGREALGDMYQHTTRIALFEHGQMPTRAEVLKCRQRFTQYVEFHRPQMLVILPTPDAQSGEGASAVTGTTVWACLRPPDNLAAMRLTFWLRNATLVMAGYPVARRSKQLHIWAMAQGLRRAASKPLLQCQHLTSEVVGNLAHLLRSMEGDPLAVDLEFVPTHNIVTAIGLSNGRRAISIPWHTYRPRKATQLEPGLSDYHCANWIKQEVAELLAANTPKYAHNFVADIPRLRELGFKVGGSVHDTFAAHAIAYPELPHGLQTAAASVLPVPPWKSLFKPKNTALTRDDEEFYIADPRALREYNAKDAFYTWHLAQKVLPLVGVNPTSGCRV